MSVRVRVALALIVAVLVPLLGAYAVAGVLLPRSSGAAEHNRLSQEATTATTVLARECAGVGDLARLVVAQLQVAGSVVGAEVALVDAVAAAAPDVVSEATADRSGTVVFVLAPDGSTVVADGDDAREAAVDPGEHAGRSCSTGAGAEGSTALVEQLPVTLGAQEVATVLVVRPLDDDALTGLRDMLGLRQSDLAVLDPAMSEPVVGLAVQAGDDAARTDVVEGLALVDGSAAQGQVAGRSYAVGAPIAATGLRPVVIGPARVSVLLLLGLALLVSLLAAAVLVQLLSASLTRPLTELAELARQIAAGEERRTDPAAPESPPDPDDDLAGVGVVLRRLASDLRTTEADVERGRGDLVDAFTSFGRTMEQTHDRDGLLRSYLRAVLLAAGSSMAVIMHDEPGRATPRRIMAARGSTPRSPGLSPQPEHDDEADETDEIGELGADVRESLTSLGERALRERGAVQDPGSAFHGPAWAMPLSHDGRYLGAVVVARDTGRRPFDAVSLDALVGLVGSAGTALFNEQQHREAERLSVTDPLTGLGNFRHLTSMLSREVERAARFDHPLGVLMVDVDHFKVVNDTHGHGPGDAVLRELARRLRECVREVDTVARYGGEEFALLLPETDLAGTGELARRVVQAFRSENFRLPGGVEVAVTGSVGAASYPLHGQTGNELMRAADAAMYAAKASGRDRFVVAPVGSTTPPAQPRGQRTT